MAFDFDRLRSAVEWSVRQLEEPRRNRVDAVRQYVGSHYASSGAEQRVPVNMLELAVTIYVRHLAARAPRVMVSTGVDALKPFARNMELALNQVPEEIGLEATLRRAVVEAIFGIGVVKVGLASSGVALLGHDAGEPFCDLVSLDDYFLDMSAKSRDAIQFEGNDYWLDIDSARELDEGGVGLEPDEHVVTGEQGEPRAEGVSASTGADLYRDKVWLRDVWLPATQELVTYSVKGKRVLRVIPWDGPENGPYHVLSFSDVPGNLLPLPPVALWRDLHELSNAVFRKLGKQAVAKKRVVTFAGGNDEAATALQKASDGDGIRYDGQAPQMIDVGGIDAAGLAFFLQARDLFNYFAGNLDALGGLAPLSETATQDQLMSQAAGARMARMKSEAIGFVRGIFRSIGWYEWTDPVRKRTVKKPVRGTDMVLEAVWSEETREGDFLDFNLDIDPYSMEDDTPSTKLQKIGQTFERFLMPLMPLMAQQGAQIDFRKLVELVAKLGNVDEVRELVQFSEPIPGQPQGGSGMPTFKPAQTKRTYERVNRPGATRAGKDDVMSRLLMGGGVQDSEAASLGRGLT